MLKIANMTKKKKPKGLQNKYVGLTRKQHDETMQNL